MSMNIHQAKNNRFKNGEYKPNHSEQAIREIARINAPTAKMVNYRDDLRGFCISRGLISESFHTARTYKGIKSEIRALITILEKHGLAEEFYARDKNQPSEDEC